LALRLIIEKRCVHAFVVKEVCSNHSGESDGLLHTIWCQVGCYTSLKENILSKSKSTLKPTNETALRRQAERRVLQVDERADQSGMHNFKGDLRSNTNKYNILFNLRLFNSYLNYVMSACEHYIIL